MRRFRTVGAAFYATGFLLLSLLVVVTSGLSTGDLPWT